MNMIWVSAAVSWVPVPKGKKISENLGNLRICVFYRVSRYRRQRKKQTRKRRKAKSEQKMIRYFK
jgi:hypothetical protein